MKKTLEILNSLEEKGCFTRYAIGGAMAASFYVEPVLTYDLDVFILVEDMKSLAVPALIYSVLKNMGFEEKGECVDIFGTPVQFLPVYNALLEDALSEAVETDYDGVPTRVPGIEHLLAICVRTGRTKDRDALEEKWDAWIT